MRLQLSNRHKIIWVVIGITTLLLWGGAGAVSAQTDPSGTGSGSSSAMLDQLPSAPEPVAPVAPVAGTPGAETPGADTTGTNPLEGLLDGEPGPAKRDGKGDDSGKLEVNIDLGQGNGKEVPSRTVTIILGLTVLAVAPSLLIMMTSFTRMVVVLSLTRNALGVQSIPPNQVLVGLAMFLTFFVMAPVLTQVNDTALQPYLNGDITQSQALKEAEGPIKSFMLANTRSSDLGMMVSMQGGEKPESAEKTSLIAVIPAFVLSELRSAFIIGIVLFVPFVILDLVVSAVLMSLGMMMLPPVFISLPLKLLVFVMVDGWALTVQALVSNYRPG
ncbi:MAG: flagellar type III secretion system pore protein FliP [Microthrixaceae bacterium]